MGGYVGQAYYELLVLLLTSGAGLAGIFFYKRRKMKKS